MRAGARSCARPASRSSDQPDPLSDKERPMSPVASKPAPDVLISECGPRDGLQILKQVMATADKLRWIDALYAAGLREIEVCSFVPAKLMPQMADAATVVKHALTLPGLTVLVLVPNLRGAEAALT